MRYRGDFLVWNGERLLARVVDYGAFCRAFREPCCSIGEYFAVLSFLNDMGFNAR